MIIHPPTTPPPAVPPPRVLPPLLLSVLDAATRIGVKRTTLYGLVSKGDLSPVKVGRRTLFRADELDAWIEQLPRVSTRQSREKREAT